MNRTEYDAALKRLLELVDQDPLPGSPEAEEQRELTDKIVAYEALLVFKRPTGWRHWYADYTLFENDRWECKIGLDCGAIGLGLDLNVRLRWFSMRLAVFWFEVMWSKPQ